ncbi:NB-ARC domains-containing protein [Tanacetum coccineum]
MAEIIASTLLEAVFKKLADEAVKEVGRVKGIRSELKSLKETLSRIQALLADASDKEIKQVPVQNWLNDLKHLAYDIDDFLDKLATDAMRPKFVKNSGASTSKVRKLISSCCTNLSLYTKTHHRLDKINLRLQELENKKTTIGLSVKNGGLEVGNNRSKDKNRVLETSLVDKDELIDKAQCTKKLDCGQLKQLQCLSHDDAVSLFCQNALDANNFDLYPTLKQHGEDIVRKCKGLPLALIALGSLHELPELLKQLFAYCSLFPKDDLFKKDDLVLLWMAEGFLHQPDHPSKLTEERLGHYYFEELLSRSFFQHAPDNESLFVMHDLMHDLATSVAGEFFFRLEKGMGNNLNKLALEKLRHMSFVRGEYEAYKKFKEGNCLRTFLSVGVTKRWLIHFMPNNVLADLLPQLPLLRVINLSNYNISEVPECFGSLKHLRYINLSRTNITSLPETVCDLYNLQTLILFGCTSLSKLPNNFSKLMNLRHLDIRYTPDLKDMPLGIGELKSLQTLSKIIIGGENDFCITQLKDLKNLRGGVSIEGLNKVKEATEAREANLSQKKLNELELVWSDVSDGSVKETDIKDVLDALKPYDGDLKNLRIVNYCGLVFPKWVGDTSFLRLAHVSMRGCKNCTFLPPFGQLPSLKVLSIQHMDNVKVVGSEFLGNGVSFTSLEVLSFEHMRGWEVCVGI